MLSTNSPMNTLPNVNQRCAYIYFKHLRNQNRRNNYNVSKVNTGNPGSGKTVEAIISSYVINPRRFDENSYVNTAKEFITRVDDSKKGDCIIWDEAGVSLSNRRWQSLSNILTGEVLQTYRINYLTVFFIAPDFSFIDVAARRLIDIFSESKRYDNKQSKSYLYNINIDRKKGDMYFPWFKIRTLGHIFDMPKLIIPKTIFKKVPKTIWKGIKEKEVSFKTRTRTKSLAMIKLIEQEDKTERTVYDIVNEIESNRNNYTNTKGKLDLHLIQYNYKIGRDKAQQIVKFLNKKAYNKKQLKRQEEDKENGWLE